jgi:hypothetical protein
MGEGGICDSKIKTALSGFVLLNNNDYTAKASSFVIVPSLI